MGLAYFVFGKYIGVYMTGFSSTGAFENKTEMPPPYQEDVLTAALTTMQSVPHPHLTHMCIDTSKDISTRDAHVTLQQLDGFEP